MPRYNSSTLNTDAESVANAARINAPLNCESLPNWIPHVRFSTCVMLVVCALGIFPAPVLSGGGPENLFLVVNTRSWASQTVANHFIALRQIPPDNVMYLDWAGDNDNVKIDVFRDDILNPILAAIDARGLTPQIDYIIYSSDLPYRINYKDDLPREYRDNPPLQDKFTYGSINSLTFLAPMVLKKDIGYRGLATNNYMGQRHPEFGRGAAYGFRADYGWDALGERVDDGGSHYFLSTMLAVTSGRGNSVPEAISYLRRAAAADGQRPAGTVYFVKVDDVRSTTREPGFDAAVGLLKKLGVAAEVITGNKQSPLPVGKDDVCGAMIGWHSFSWRNSRSTILPGAICEHFTSFGGVMNPNSSQTPLSEFLRYGAAGASGTVVEPYSLRQKFPIAPLHAYYAQGATLAEAFYQSVMGPYQLLIVGDPLCRPWARIPKVDASGVKPGATVKGMLAITPSGEVDDSTINHFELFVDGRRTAACRSTEELPLDTTTLSDGYHELRIVAVAARPLETQGRLIVPIVVSNRNQSVLLQASPNGRAVWNDPLTLTVKAAGAAGCDVYHNSRLLGTLQGDGGRLRIEPRQLGHGPVTLRAVARFPGTDRHQVSSAPLHLNVEPNRPKSGRPTTNTAQLRPGLKLRAGRGPAVPIQRTSKYVWMGEAGVEAGQDFSFGGFFEIAAADVYQFQVRHIGSLAIEVDGATVYQGTERQRWQQAYIPLSLGPGLHTLRVSGNSARSVPRVDLRFGNTGVDYVDGRLFRNY